MLLLSFFLGFGHIHYGFRHRLKCISEAGQLHTVIWLPFMIHMATSHGYHFICNCPGTYTRLLRDMRNTWFPFFRYWILFSKMNRCVCFSQLHHWLYIIGCFCVPSITILIMISPRIARVSIGSSFTN